MPFKLIGTIILLVLVTVFAGFNIDNKCNINLIFRQFNDVPIFFSLMIAFVAGVFVMIPFTLGKSAKAKKSSQDKKLEKQLAKEARKEAKKAEKLMKKNKGKSASGEPPVIISPVDEVLPSDADAGKNK